MPLTPDQIHVAIKAPLANIQEGWPLIVAALDEFGVRSHLVEVAAAATVGVETSVFRPIKELRASKERQPVLWALQARYWPYCGRGYVQTTWEDGYRRTGNGIGVELLAAPDKLLEPGTAARALGWFFADRRIALLANAKDWVAVRRRVNGGVNGLPVFLSYVQGLLEVSNA